MSGSSGAASAQQATQAVPHEQDELEFLLPSPKRYAEITASDVPPGIDPDRLAIEYYEYWNSLRD